MRSLRVVELHVEPMALRNVNAPHDLIDGPIRDRGPDRGRDQARDQHD